MNLKNKIAALLLLFVCSYSYGQIGQHSASESIWNYQRELSGITEQWHKIVVPDEIFGKTATDLSDIRIFGVTAENDTVEAPYYLRQLKEKTVSDDISFQQLNTVHLNRGHFFTFEIPTTESVNQIDLNFKEQNFDWQIKLQGSQNRKEWFTIIEDYRILSIKNEHTDFQFTKLSFPDAKYRLFKLSVYSNGMESPHLETASITRNNITEGVRRDCAVRKIDIKENKQTKQTEIEIDLQLPVPVSTIEIPVLDDFDYYRSMTIKYLTDSVETEQGWKYNYQTLAIGTLNSLQENAFEIKNKTVQKLKIFIHNQDNQPLNIGNIQLKQYVQELVVRFTEPATYYLAYGNKKVGKPRYDIDRFKKNVPETLSTLALGKENTIVRTETPDTEPLFENKFWLWAVMGLTILVLGWFSLKMFKGEK